MRFQTVGVALVASLAGACSAIQGSKAPEVTLVERVSAAPAAADPAVAAGLAESGRFESAAAAWRATLTADPANQVARYGLAEALRQLGKLDEARAEYAMLAASDAWRARASEGLGLTALASGDRNDAYEVLSSAVEADAALWRAHLGLAQLSDFDREWVKSDASYGAALKASDKPAIVHNNQGISLLARGDAKAAAAAFNRALAADPSFERAKVNLDLANAADGRSIADLAKAEPDPKKRAQLLNNYGYVAMLQGRLNEAESYFNGAIESHPSFYPAAFENLNVLKAMKSQS